MNKAVVKLGEDVCVWVRDWWSSPMFSFRVCSAANLVLCWWVKEEEKCEISFSFSCVIFFGFVSFSRARSNDCVATMSFWCGKASSLIAKWFTLRNCFLRFFNTKTCWNLKFEETRSNWMSVSWISVLDKSYSRNLALVTSWNWFFRKIPH